MYCIIIETDNHYISKFIGKFLCVKAYIVSFLPEHFTDFMWSDLSKY